MEYYLCSQVYNYYIVKLVDLVNPSSWLSKFVIPHYLYITTTYDFMSIETIFFAE